VARGRLPTPFALLGLIGLARSYAFWYDFFEANRVRLALAPLYHFTVPQTLALDALGGVTAAYQYALGGLNGSWVSAGENVQFVFGRQFENAWHDLGAPVHCLVRTGFIDDSAIRRIRTAGGRPESRKALAAAGAKYVLCFFDENTHNAWWCFYWHDDAVRDYEFLCRWLLEDPTLGIVIKPKREATLADRIRPVADLVERAKATGRLLFLQGNRYPTEAALNADLVVGKFVGGTASLEARLAGLPAVMVNTEGLRVNPQWAWTKGRVVFPDWPSARAAIEAHRRDSAAHPEFGDWSPGLPDLDPFRDGEAGLRIGLFLRWTYDALKAGAKPEEAVLGACDEFGRRWRPGEITILRRPAAGREPERSPQA
jgi:hypothetical protein